MDDLDALLRQASSMLDCRAYAEARVVLSEIIAKSSKRDRAHAHALRGWSWFQEADYVEALEDFSAAIALYPEVPNTLFLRAQCREELDDPAGALADYQALLAINPSTPDAWEAAAVIHRYFGRREEADMCAMRAETAHRELLSKG